MGIILSLDDKKNELEGKIYNISWSLTKGTVVHSKKSVDVVIDNTHDLNYFEQQIQIVTIAAGLQF